MRPKNRHGKRQQGWQEEESEVDDLAVAATFAQVTAFPAKEAEEQQDTSTRSSDSDKQKEDEEQESDSDEKSNTERKPKVDDVSKDDSDDESDVDLSEALANMKDDDDEDPTKSSKGESQAPTTEHELDPYRTPISDLESKFHLNLTVAEQERLRLDKETDVPAAGPVQLCAVSRLEVMESIISFQKL